MQTIGIDLGGTTLTAGVVDQQGVISLRKTVDTDRANGEAIIAQIVELIRSLALPGEDLCVGIAIPGWVDSKAGKVVTCTNIPLQGVFLAERLAATLSCAVKIENDANCATLGEQRFGAAKNCKNLVLLTLGTGLGGGAMVNGTLLTGVGSAEFGHLLMVRDGLLCGCGRHGCREVYCSTTALIRMANERTGGKYRRAKEIFDDISSGDQVASAALQEYIGYLADCIVDFINAFHPELILLGGGITAAGDMLFSPLHREIERICTGFIGGFDLPPVLPAQNRNDAGILGAAALFF